MDNSIIEFKAIIDRLVKDSGNFKMYAVTPISEKESLKFNKYGNVSISGDIHELTLGMEYFIQGQENKYGYEVINIKREKPNSINKTIDFLTEVITETQAKTLLSVYPDIVNKIINNDLDDVDLKKTKGIKEKKFEIIKDKIIENFPLIDFIDEFKEYGISLKMARKMYKSFSSIERMKEKMLKDPYETLCSISGIGFKKADSMILAVEKNQNLRTSIQRIKSCVKYCLNESEGNGNTWISLEDLSTQCNDLVPESIDFLIDALVDDEIYVDGKNRKIAYKSSYNTEKYISEKLINILRQSKNLMIEYNKYFKVDGIDLTEEQQNVLRNFCKYNVSLLVGNAGSGKSQTIASVIQLCDDNNLDYILMTPTGKSSQVLAEYTNRDAGTIHRKLEYNPAFGWGYNSENKLKCDVVIVDENGMTDIFLMKHLLEAIETTKTRILFVQDDAQLPSVSCGNCAFDMINSGIIPISRLTKVFRYGEGGLLQIATKIRNGEKYVDNTCDDITTFGVEADYSLIPVENEYISDYVIGVYEKLLNQGYEPLDILVLSSKNVNENGTIELNKILQNKVNPFNENKKHIAYGDNVYIVNDIVMQIKNNYKATNEYDKKVTITNGDIGKIINIEDGLVYVQYKKDLIIYAKDELDQIQLAYSISIHKSQGSGVKNVILVTPTSHKWNLNKNLLYVGITRAKERCFHISLPETINYGIKKSIELQRDTFLKELLIEYGKI